MRIGVMLPMSRSDGSGGVPGWTEMRDFATHAEAIGLDSVWVYDHLLFRSVDEPDEPIHESWTVLSALAAVTSRVELGQLVMCVSFRSPALLAKMAVTADAISDGRLLLGLGAGWHDPEYEAFGFPTDHRASRFDEALQIISPLLGGEQVSLDGRYHQVADAVLLPAPERKIPILVAGQGPRMLGLTARYADAWNTAWYAQPDERLDARLADLRSALEAAGRDPATMRVTVGAEWNLARPDSVGGGSADALASAMEAFEGRGVDDLIVVVQPADRANLDLIARAVELRGH